MILRRLSRRIAPFTLGLALWMAFPSFEWCPYSWAECRESCDAAESIACEMVKSCDLAGDATTACAATSDACTPTAGCFLPCDPEPVPLGDRAWCVHPPIEGLVVSPVVIEPPVAAPVLATLARPLDVQPSVAEVLRAVTTVFQSPVLIAPHAPPLARAPPSPEPGTRS